MSKAKEMAQRKKAERSKLNEEELEEEVPNNPIDEEEEPEENTNGNSEQSEVFSAFKEPVKERAYTTPIVESQRPLNEIQLEEPAYSRPVINLDDISQGADTEEPIQQPNPNDFRSEPEPPRTSIFDDIENPAMADLSNKEKKQAAATLVDAILAGYGGLHEVARKFATISDDKLREMSIKGEIDMTMVIPISRNKNISIKELVDDYNSSAKEAIYLDPEFVEIVRPLMIQVFAKRSMGLTPEQALIYYFGKDVATKAFQIIALKSSINNLLKQIKEHQQESTKPQQPSYNATSSYHNEEPEEVQVM